MIINFQCQRCARDFDGDVGAVSMGAHSDRPVFEKPLICPSCGVVTMDEVWLTEVGQSQLTEATFPFDTDSFGDTDDESQHGPCEGCDDYQDLNDIGLCAQCAAKLDRDLIRQRDWAYSTAAFCVAVEDRERLRSDVIAKHGEKLELIAPSHGPKSNPKKKKRKKHR